MTQFSRRHTLGLACLTSTTGGSAMADCSDFAAPGVNWRRCLQDGQDLRGDDLSGATLDDAAFKRADLSGANLARADARRAKSVSATTHDGILDEARLRRADLTSAHPPGPSPPRDDLTNGRQLRPDLNQAE